MAVVNCIEGRSKEALRTAWFTQNDSRIFSVLVDDATTGKVDAGNASGLPVMGSFWNDMRANSINVHPTKNAYLFEVEVVYETQFYSPNEPIGDPLSKPIDAKWSFVKMQDYFDEDWMGNPIVNSAGLPFDPGITDDVIIQVGTFTRNEALYNPALAREYMNCTNEDTWFDWEPGKAKVDDIQAQRVYDRGFVYWQMTYVIACNEYGWKRRVRDESYYIWEQNAITLKWKLVPIKDKEGNAVTQPIPLDGNGNELPFGEDAVYLEFQTKGSKPFAPLALY